MTDSLSVYYEAKEKESLVVNKAKETLFCGLIPMAGGARTAIVVGACASLSEDFICNICSYVPVVPLLACLLARVYVCVCMCMLFSSVCMQISNVPHPPSHVH